MVSASWQRAFPQTADDRNESERSDRLTGGRVMQAEFEPDRPDIRITLNVPSFRLTLWQNGKEVKSYYVGVGMKEHPIYIGDRQASEIIWNPAWIPPASDWVSEIKSVRPGEIIKASDPRNPLGKMKIPLGDRYLIHQAAKMSDVGNLVSHGCVRMPRPDLYDLAEKIICGADFERFTQANRSCEAQFANTRRADTGTCAGRHQLRHAGRRGRPAPHLPGRVQPGHKPPRATPCRASRVEC
jgi:hypothetical protein